ncbi:MAG TPA: right-handed parallel beta-helix repeat-containing protein, partial [Kiritimatiellia bacterium]|nr:right-handed parallel beta-helix repeat-containing protein [Kiritimatiellia bacterium]
SRTNAWLQLLTYMDGAPLSATDGAWVRWDGGQYETNATVRILLSRDSGLTWEVLETNVTASLGSFFYQEAEPDNTSSYSARLRVELEDDPEAGSGTGSESPMDFIYRNGSFAYYINDASTAGDMYCGAPGSDSNVGTSSNLPMANLHALVAKFITFGPGDRIYIDTGSYTATNPVVLGPAQSGTPSDPIVIEGSTNRLAGGTVFGASGTARPMGFEFQSGASNLVLRDIIVTNRQTGILMGTVSNLLLHRVEVRGGTSRAFDLNGSRHVTLSNCVAHGGGAGVYLNNARVIAIRHGVFWENSPAIQRASGTDGFEVRNSILGSTRTGGTLFSLNSATGFTSDYNGLYAGPNTRVGTLGGAAADNAAAWQSLTGGQDRHSVPGEPQMANPGAATAEEFAYDYHLKTEETLGRLRRDGTRKNDTTSSPLLDAGDPEGGAGEEPEPNGGRVNIGVWGGTEEASKAPATAPWLKTVSFGDGGSVSSGVIRLVWTAGGGFSNQTATVEVSVDGGESWASPPAATNVPITNGWADWTVAGLPATPGGAWRVVCEQSTNQWARSTNFFAIRTNGSLDLYVATVDTN